MTTIGTEQPTESVIVHAHPQVRCRSVEIREHRDPIRMANGRWTYMPYGFVVYIDGRGLGGCHRSIDAAIESVGRWIDFLEWDTAGRPWPPR